MADLSPRGRRGQILLITAFVLAVIFVGLALVMNTVIYSENLATRADSTTSEPILQANSMETGTEAVIRYINEHNTSETMTAFSPLRTDLEEALQNISDVSGRHSLRNGQVTNTSLGPVFEGTWIRQTDPDRDFTNVSGSTDWRLVDGANGARTLRIFVTNASIASGSAAFTIQARDSAGATWRLHLGNNEVSGQDSQGNSFSCTTTGSGTDFWVNVSAGLVNDNECTNLHFADHLDPIDRIDVDDAQKINGTYRLIVNTTQGSIDPTHYGSAPADPFLERGIYGTWIDIDFERESLVFRTERRVIPGADDD